MNCAGGYEDTGRFSFMGSSVRWVATKGLDRSRTEVWIDGVNVGGIDLYAASEQPRKMAFAKTGLSASEPHALEVRVLGTRNSVPNGSRADVDAFTVLSSP